MASRGSQIEDLLAFSPDGNSVASGLGNHTVRIWDAHSSSLIGKPLIGHVRRINSVTYSPLGNIIASSSFDCILLWDSNTRRQMGDPILGTPSTYSIAFSPDTKLIASGCGRGLFSLTRYTVKLWDVEQGKATSKPFKGYTSYFRSVQFSPDESRLVSGSLDKTVRVWDVERGTAIIGPLKGHTGKSILQIFDCLTASGCVDLSSQMDPEQETAMIVSGGGFGDIWQGQLHNGGVVAIKAWRAIARDQCDYKTLKRAARELYCWSQMDHPNIHRLQGVIMFRGQYLGMVSEWMDNGNLPEYLIKFLSVDRYQLCIHAASGLEYMHSHTTVHGDLKAANVLVSSDGVAKISDFDFSVISGVTSLVFTGTSNSRAGSLRWMAPELLLEEAPERTRESDVYALGMTMLEIFTGDVPYPDRRQDIGVIRAVERGTLPTRPIKRLGDNIKGNMMWHLLIRCWAWEFRNRPSSRQVVETLMSNKMLSDE
ncbi:Tyrosine-protein kinase FRK [Rhizoctonia solani]|uniref:Tyrosine-protein kinase FRK n=1 Tax=Rhizoctonia solani TaxID=456999 RepID=A0A0K6FXZ7_9AGAM|nr:Tyrosine-protein kinase FRK [Rhizoctonia solani]